MDINKIKKEIELAKQVSEEFEKQQELKEPYRSISYRLVLEKAFSGIDRETKGEITKRKKQPKRATPKVRRAIKDEKLEKILKTDKDIVSPYKYIHELSNTEDKSYTILKIAEDEFNIRSLTPAQISEVLQHKFRISIDKNTINVTLGKKAGKEVDRKLEGQTYSYWLLDAGKDSLKRKIEETQRKSE